MKHRTAIRREASPEYAERARRALAEELRDREANQARCDEVFRQMQAELNALNELHAERERLDLPFDTIQERSGMTDEEIEGLKTNRPRDLISIRNYAAALGMQLELSLSRIAD